MKAGGVQELEFRNVCFRRLFFPHCSSLLELSRQRVFPAFQPPSPVFRALRVNAQLSEIEALGLVADEK